MGFRFFTKKAKEPSPERVSLPSQELLIDDIADLTEQGLYVSALDAFASASQIISEPILRLLLLHNHAVLYWSMLGIGDKALSLIEDEWALWESLEDKDEAAQRIISMAAENAMLLAPSAECFLAWRDRLKSVCADAQILREIGRRYEEEYEEGTPWWNFMARLATGFYHRSAGAVDQGRYGNGAAAWQIMLANQKPLRLPVDIQKMAAQEYGTLTVRLFAMDERRLSGASQAVLKEAALPVRLCGPYIKAYIENHPGDEVETVVYPPIREILERFGSERQ